MHKWSCICVKLLIVAKKVKRVLRLAVHFLHGRVCQSAAESRRCMVDHAFLHARASLCLEFCAGGHALLHAHAYLICISTDLSFI